MEKLSKCVREIQTSSDVLIFQLTVLVSLSSVPVVGDVPCIVSSGEGGFIPVRFISESTVQMSGHSNHLQNSE